MLVLFAFKNCSRVAQEQAWFHYCHQNRKHRKSETLFEEDLKFMELLLSKNKDLVKIKKVKDEECGIETTYITIKKNV